MILNDLIEDGEGISDSKSQKEKFFKIMGTTN